MYDPFMCGNMTNSCPLAMGTGLSRLTTDEKLKEAFSSFGQIVDGKMQNSFCC